MKINPYLVFNGQCEEALRYYEKNLGGKVEFKMTYGESPAAQQTPPEWQKKIMHARYVVEDNVLMASDGCPDRYEKPQGLRVTINVDDPARAEKIYQALSEKGTVQMPLEETFWAQRFAMLIDQFGTPWMINCEK